MSDETETVTGEVVRYAPAPVEEYRPRIMLAPEEAKAIDDALRANMKAILREDVDYGVIPGTGNKPSLLKPGAEKLLQWFGFGHAMNRSETERDASGNWMGVTYRCTVTKAMPDGRTVTVAECEGCAGYDEDHFYTTAEQAEAKERANAERYRRAVNKAKFAEFRAPRNSVIKMAQKRAMVGAALQATSASSLFTQDMEDTVAPAAPAAPLAEAARQALFGVPAEARRAFARWYRDQGWDEPQTWDAGQWCAGLIQAGKIAMEQVFAAGGVALTPAEPPASDTPQPTTAPAADEARATPANDPWYTDAPAGPATAPPADGAWLIEALGLAAGFATVAEGQDLWRKNAAQYNAGAVTTADRKRIEMLIQARIDDLRAKSAEAEPVKGVVVSGLEPGDPWAVKVESITSPEDAEAALADLEVSRKGGMDGRHYATVKAAIRAKAASLPVGAPA